MRTILFWGTPADFAIARKTADEIRASGHKAFTRDAAVFAGDVEPCDKVVMFSSVTPLDAKRISNAYRQAQVEIERSDGASPAPVLDPTLKVRTPLSLNEKLRRLTNRELRALAHERGVNIEHARDRATMMAAIEAAEKEDPP